MSIICLDFPKAIEKVSLIGGCEGQVGRLDRQGERSSSVVIRGFLRKEGSKYGNNSLFSTWEAENNRARSKTSPEASVVLSIFNDLSNEVQ